VPPSFDVPPSLDVPLSLVPPSVVPHGPPHVPLDDPGGKLQTMPGQQSALFVHAPQRATHAAPQMNGAPASVPASFAFGFGTHARPQQSALDAHGVPCGTPPSGQSPVIVQRGMPRRSCLQSHGCVCTVPAQQRSVALHEFVDKRQIAPAGEQRLPLSQRPTGSFTFCFAQCTLLSAPPVFVPGAPQQSLS
jgi:hypothetical protein